MRKSENPRRKETSCHRGQRTPCLRISKNSNLLLPEPQVEYSDNYVPPSAKHRTVPDIVASSIKGNVPYAYHHKGQRHIFRCGNGGLCLKWKTVIERLCSASSNVDVHIAKSIGAQLRGAGGTFCFPLLQVVSSTRSHLSKMRLTSTVIRDLRSG